MPIPRLADSSKPDLRKRLAKPLRAAMTTYDWYISIDFEIAYLLAEHDSAKGVW